MDRFKLIHQYDVEELKYIKCKAFLAICDTGNNAYKILKMYKCTYFNWVFGYFKAFSYVIRQNDFVNTVIILLATSHCILKQ